MPTLHEAKNVFDSMSNWVHYGDEWSSGWGGPLIQWYAAVLPRICRYLPAHTIVDIGAGQGRFAQFLKDYSKRLILIDLSEQCIETCKSRFASENHIEYFVNDGKSLDMIEDDSIDFAFSHDALVFSEAPEFNEYLKQLADKLKSDGVAFLHHSNLGAYWYYQKLSQSQIKLLRKLNLIEKDAWRAYTVSAESVNSMCERAGLQCIVQELMTWSTHKTLVDCYSTIVHKDSRWSQERQVFTNRGFMNYKKHLSRVAKYYYPHQKKYKSVSISYDTAEQLAERH